MVWVVPPFARHDYPAGGAPSINSRESTDMSIGKAAEGLAFTRSSTTALEGGLVKDAPQAAADAYSLGQGEYFLDANPVRYVCV
jgi:hypothetical protein